jgi:hypothetical protein
MKTMAGDFEAEFKGGDSARLADDFAERRQFGCRLEIEGRGVATAVELMGSELGGKGHDGGRSSRP